VSTEDLAAGGGAGASQMSPDEMVGAAIAAAGEGLAAGELPIGAVVVLGGEVISRDWTRELARGRRLVHADLLALTAADERLGWRRRSGPLVLAGLP
jgi:tRNA(adenine34) deaminase